MNRPNTFYDLEGLNVKSPGNRLSLIILSILSILLYANTFTHDFALDDVAAITKNSFVQKGVAGIPDILTTGSWDGFNPEKNMKIYRPFQIVTLAVQYEFFEQNPMPYHIVHVLCYALLNCLLFLLLKEFWGNKYPYLPLLIAILFAVHPVHTDVIANIKGSADLFAMLNAIVAFLFLFHFIKHKKIYKIVIACLFYFLSLVSKEIAVTYIAVFPLAMFYFTDLKVKSIIKNTSPFIGVFLLYLFVRAMIFSGSNAMKMSISSMSNSILLAESFSQKVGTTCYGLGKNVQLLVFPHPLKSTYVHADIPIIEAYDFISVSTICLYLFLAFAGVYYFRKKSLLIFGILYYLITISLFSNTLVMMPSILSERWLLIPSLGFCIVVGTLLYKTFKHSQSVSTFLKANVTPVLALAMLLFLFSYQTVGRNFDWKNDITLFAADIEAAPNNHFALRGYGSELIKSSDPEKIREGLKYLQKAREIAPNRYGTNNNIAVAYRKLNELDEAILAFKKELTLDPTNKKVRQLLWNCYNKRGIELLKSRNHNKIKQSIPYFKNAHQLQTNGYQAAHNLGKAYYLSGDLKNAIATYQNIVKNVPAKYDSVYALGVVYNSAKQYHNALEVLVPLSKVKTIDQSGLAKQLKIAHNGLAGTK